MQCPFSLRIFSAYGPGLRKQLFWDIYNKLKNNDIIELWGTGNETRDFIHISDLVKAIECVVENADFNATTVNIASGIQTSVRTIAETFVRLMKSDKIIQFNNEERKGDPVYWQADITDLKEWGYEPAISLEEGMKNYIEWIEKEQ